MRRSLAPVLLAALAVIAGCGGGGDSAGESSGGGTPLQAVAAAATKTGQEGSSRVSFVVSLSGVGSQQATIKGDGVFDSARHVGQMQMDLSDLGNAAGGMQLGKAEVIFDRLVVYMKFPFLAQMQPNMKPWLKLDLAQIGNQQGFDLGQLTQLNQGDPTQALAYLRAASSDTKKVGEEDVRGTHTTRYHMTVDLKKVAATAPPAQRKQIQASIDQLVEKSGIRHVPADVWIDDEGLVRRIQLVYENFRFAAGQQGTMALTQELYDFGVDVKVSPPPADQITDLSTLLGGA